jgi:hypothetical protein
MKELIDAIKAWPIIIQGALGSALFWLVLIVGQKLADAILPRISSRNRVRQRRRLFDQILRLEAVKAGQDKEQATYYASAILYRASRRFVVAVIWLTLGFIFHSVIGIFGLVGYLGCLYYLFATLAIVGPVKTPPSRVEAELAELQKKLRELKD